MAKKAKYNYKLLYKRYLESGLSLKKYCENRKEKLPYDTVKKAFQKLKKGDGKEKPLKNPQKKKAGNTTNKGGKKTPSPTRNTRKRPEKNEKQLTHRQQILLELEMSKEGMTHAEMAKIAGYKNKNLSQAFSIARKSANYMETLSRSQAELRARIGIPGEYLLGRLIEIGLTRIGDIAEMVDGELLLREDVSFDDGSDLAIKGFTIKKSVSESENKSSSRSETKTELKIEQADNKGALESAIRLGGYFDAANYNSRQSKDPAVIELWYQYEYQEITAKDFANGLEAIGIEVPAMVSLAAKAEMMKETGDSDFPKDLDLLDGMDDLLDDGMIQESKDNVVKVRTEQLKKRKQEIKELNEQDDLEIELKKGEFEDMGEED